MIARHMTASSCWAALALVLTWGCGGKTNLLDPSWNATIPDSGSAGDAVAAPAPQQVIGNQSAVCNIVVQNGRVYWSTTADGPLGQPEEVRGCDVEDCQSTTTIYASPSYAWAAIAVDDATIYFAGQGGLKSCPIAGCPDTAATVVEKVYASIMVADPTTLFWTYRGGPGPLACAKVGCIPRAIDLEDNTGRTAGSIAIDDSAVYWIREGASGSVKRADKTGGTPVELASQQNQPVGLFVDNDFVYWTTRWASGDVLRCPQSGCEGQPTVLASNQPRPTSLVVDSNSVFWTVAPSSPSHDDVGESINRCDLDHCAETQTTLVAGIHPSGCAQNLAQDDSYVYWAEGSPGFGTMGTQKPEGVVMRIRK